MSSDNGAVPVLKVHFQSSSLSVKSLNRPMVEGQEPESLWLEDPDYRKKIGDRGFSIGGYILAADEEVFLQALVASGHTGKVFFELATMRMASAPANSAS